MPDRYPGYDVLQKRNSPSWNDQTRAVIDERLAIDPNTRRFFTEDEWPTMRAVCDRIVPQTVARPVRERGGLRLRRRRRGRQAALALIALRHLLKLRRLASLQPWSGRLQAVAPSRRGSLA